MSDTGQGDGQRSWWEKPDPDQPTQDAPYRAAGSGQDQPTDVHDPYRSPSGPAADPSRGSSSDPYSEPRPGSHASRSEPTQSVPQHGQPQHYGQPQQHGQPQQGAPSWAQQGPGYPPLQSQRPQPQNQPQNQVYGDYGGSAQQGQGQYGAGQYGVGQYAYGQQQPVAGLAHAVLWTAVGGLLLVFSGLGWIAAIVALALTPGARREITESQGAKRGLGFLLAGKICAWVTIGLSALIAIGLVVIFARIAQSGGFDSSPTYDSVGAWTSTP